MLRQHNLLQLIAILPMTTKVENIHHVNIVVRGIIQTSNVGKNLIRDAESFTKFVMLRLFAKNKEHNN